MKNLYILISSLFLFLNINAQIVGISDSNFKYELVNNPLINTNGDTDIQLAEALAVIDTLDLKNKSIANLSGIEAFVNLKGLDCSNNNLSQLDLSQNINLNYLDCSFNDILNLDLSQNSYLEYVQCRNNDIASLNADNCSILNYLHCRNNNLNQLDISDCLNLEFLDCTSNQISFLDFHTNPLLTSLACGTNNLSYLNLNNTPLIEDLYFWENPITNIDLSNLGNLIDLSFGINLLTTIDLSSNSSLLYLEYFGDTLINELNLKRNTKMSHISIDGTNISKLDFSKQSNLTNVSLRDNPNLDYVNLRNSPSLISLHVINCNLSYIDLSGNDSLELAYLDGNQLEYIDLADKAFLERIRLNNNKIKNVDLSNSPNLIFAQLVANELINVNISNGNNTNMTFEVTNNPNLTCVQIDPGFTPSSNPNWYPSTAAFYTVNCNFCTPSFTYSFQDICKGEVAQFNGNSYSESGIYADTSNLNSCGIDSVLLFSLNVQKPDTILLPNDTICNGDTLSFGANSIFETGEYFVSVPIINGCDSMVSKQVYVLTILAVINENNQNLVAPIGLDSYQWYLNGVAIPNATSINYTATENGLYYAVMTFDGCSQKSNEINVNAISIEYIEELGIRIYPNPSNGYLKIQHPELIEELEIINLEGRVLLKENDLKAHLNLEGFSNGIYILNIIHNGIRYTDKLIIQK